MKNPNAAVAGGGSGLSVFLVWLAGNVFHWSLSAEDGAIVAGAIATVVLFIGRDGVRGAMRRIWRGQDGAVDLIELILIATFVVAVLVLWKVW